MSDPVKCITCGAVSYNEPGKTALHCNKCYENSQQKYYDLLSHLREAVGEIESRPNTITSFGELIYIHELKAILKKHIPELKEEE